MYRTYDELMERHALLLATLAGPYVTDYERDKGARELVRLQNEMERELVVILSGKCVASVWQANATM